MSQGLAQAKKKLELYKVDNGSYPASGSLASAGITNSDVTYEYTSPSQTSYCLTGVNGSTVYNITNTTTPATGDCNGHTWPGGVAMTNLVTNGDFSGGTSGWNGLYGAVTASGGVLSLVGNGGATSSSHLSTTSKPVAPGNKVYLRMQGRVTNAVASMMYVRVHGSTSGNTAPQTVSPINTPANGTWYTMSGVIIQPLEFAGNLQVRTFQVYATAADQTSKQMDVSYFCLIDLTEAFGAGHEPTKAQMDTIMQQYPNSWFGGTVTANTAGIL